MCVQYTNTILEKFLVFAFCLSYCLHFLKFLLYLPPLILKRQFIPTYGHLFSTVDFRTAQSELFPLPRDGSN